MPGPASFRFSHDVFLSFRGKDTRLGFIGYLYDHLHNKMEIRTFIDDRDIDPGDQLKVVLPKEIEKSRIFIIVFSLNYADSQFCLDELVKIFGELPKGNGRLVLLVFYHVDRSLLRHPTGSSYEIALAKHKGRFEADSQEDRKASNMKRLQKWKDTLLEAADSADIYGLSIKDGDDEFIPILSIVQEVSRHVARPIGLWSRVNKVDLLLNEVRMVGICGTHGIGKTTVALGVYYLIAHEYEIFCYFDVNENSIKHGSEHLQKMLFSAILEQNDIKKWDANEEISKIKKILCQTKVLLILDNVEKLEQLEATVGVTNSLGPDSKIIITTQHQCFLRDRVERIYVEKGLNTDEALTLLYSKVLDDSTVKDYANIFNRAAPYARRLPLALEIMGSHLCGKGTRECDHVLDQYGGSSNIQEILKISFDALDEYRREILINIACNFKEHELAQVEAELRALYPQYLKDDIRLLLDSSLIKISEHGRVTIHDLIQDMVRDIVQENPGKYINTS